MPVNNWAPKAVAVKEKITVTVGGTLSGETFKLGLGDPVGADEKQTATVTGTGSGGTFTLTVPLPNGSEMTTAAIDYDASAATIETALDTAFALQDPAPPSGSISVAGTDMDTGDITFTFDGAVYEKKDWPLVVFATLATGWSAAEFAETIKGLPITGQWFAEHTDSTTTIADTVAALVAAWNASTHPWAAAVAATDASPNITLEAKVAGVPFGTFKTDTDQTWESGVRGYYEITLNTPGGSATLTQDETTANRGPNCANLAANWTNGTYLHHGDEVTIADSAVDILWGLDYGSDDDNYVILNFLDIRKTFSGKIGLDCATFNGDTSAPEYRETYFKIMVDKTYGLVEIGKHEGPGAALGSRRIKLDLRGESAEVIVYASNAQPFETGKPAIRILTGKATSDATSVHIRGALGGFGIAMDQAGETSICNTVYINCPSDKDKIYISAGVHISGVTVGVPCFQQTGGSCLLRHVPFTSSLYDLRYLVLNGGVLQTEGNFRITTGQQEGGMWYANHYDDEGSPSKAVEDAILNGGVCDLRGSFRSRAWYDITQKLESHTLHWNENVDYHDFDIVSAFGLR